MTHDKPHATIRIAGNLLEASADGEAHVDGVALGTLIYDLVNQRELPSVELRDVEIVIHEGTDAP